MSVQLENGFNLLFASLQVRIQLKPAPASLYSSEGMRNEFVMRLQPDEAIYMKMVVKKPGGEH